MTTTITKQLMINSFRIPLELCEEIKGYLFVDFVYADSRNKKNKLISGLNRCLEYHPEENDNGHWSIRYGYELQLQCTTCKTCGGYEMVGNPHVYANTSRNALCSCAGFEEYYQENIAAFNAHLEFIM